ncbi:MAG: DUF58 domain-containing protein [Halofilum sp. (in: g-proteobacteria)]
MTALSGIRAGVDQWFQRRTASTGPRVALNRRRLFILPTGLGCTFAATLGLLLFGSLNYGASLGFALTFLLTGCGVIGMLESYRNLEGLAFTFAPPPAVFAGEVAQFPVEIEAPARERWAVELGREGTGQTIRRVAPGVPTIVQLARETRHRGHVPLPRLTVASRWPLLLFCVWSRLEPAVSALVYPAPIDHGYARPWADGAEIDATGTGGEEDFAGLREYRPGDSPRRIAWKALARTDELRVKAFEAATADDTWLDWASLEGLAHEARLEQLCAWVLAAERTGRAYGLILPDARIAPASGPEHRRRCLEALALAAPAGPAAT